MVTPYTVAAEVIDGGWFTSVVICYATSPTSYSGSELLGGSIVFTRTSTGWATHCFKDSNSTVTVTCTGTATILPSTGYYSLAFYAVRADTTATGPVTVYTTGVVLFSPVNHGVVLPCLLVNGISPTSTCGTPII